jgi:short-subunit dehydrogenase
MPRPVALITGPTSGVGAGFSRRYAVDGFDLVLAARNTGRLHELADKLHQEHGTNSEVLIADLARADGRSAVAERLAKGVRVLVNNADVVDDCLADVPKGKVVIIPGVQYKALTTAARMVPRNLVRLMTKTVGRGRGRT